MKTNSKSPVEIGVYAERVELLARNATAGRFTNSGPDHARIVMSNLLKNAQSSVKIFTGNVDDFYSSEQVIASTKAFLDRQPSNQIEVMFRSHAYKTKAESSEFLKAIPVERLALSVAQDARMSSHFFERDFAVADLRAFRYEHDDEKVLAIVNFNEPDVAIILTEEFDAGSASGHRN